MHTNIFSIAISFYAVCKHLKWKNLYFERHMINSPCLKLSPSSFEARLFQLVINLTSQAELKKVIFLQFCFILGMLDLKFDENDY